MNMRAGMRRGFTDAPVLAMRADGDALEIANGEGEHTSLHLRFLPQLLSKLTEPDEFDKLLAGGRV